MSFNAADPARYIEELTALTDQLAEIIERETEALAARRPLALKETETEKTALMKSYAGEMARIRKSPGFLKRAPKSLRDTLARSTKRFHDALDAQRRSLGAMKTITEKLVETIAREAQKASKPAATYGRNAGYAASPLRASPFAVNSVA